MRLLRTEGDCAGSVFGMSNLHFLRAVPSGVSLTPLNSRRLHSLHSVRSERSTGWPSLRSVPPSRISETGVPGVARAKAFGKSLSRLAAHQAFPNFRTHHAPQHQPDSASRQHRLTPALPPPGAACVSPRQKSAIASRAPSSIPLARLIHVVVCAFLPTPSPHVCCYCPTPERL